MRRALLLLVLATAGCSPQSVSGVALELVPADSVRWQQEEKDQPYALLWPSGAMNLWLRYDSHRTSTAYPYPTEPYAYSVVYRAQLAPLWLADTLRGIQCDAGGEENCDVTGGMFWVVQEGDSILRGLVMTTVATPLCGSRVDTLSLRLARADTPPHGGP